MIPLYRESDALPVIASGQAYGELPGGLTFSITNDVTGNDHSRITAVLGKLTPAENERICRLRNEGGAEKGRKRDGRGRKGGEAQASHTSTCQTFALCAGIYEIVLRFCTDCLFF